MRMGVKTMMDDKTTWVIAYIMSKTCDITKTALMKLCYFVDLVSTKERGEQITEFEYIGYRYGPFDNKIYSMIDALEYNDVIIAKVEYFGPNEHVIYNYNNDQNKISFDLIDEGDKDIIDMVIKQLSGYGAKALSEIAYKTKPMLAIDAVPGGEKHLNRKINLRAK